MKELAKICPKCGNENKDTAKFCEDCGTSLNDVGNTAMTEKPKSTSGGIMDWWNKQSSGGKAIMGIAGICCIGLILIVGISGLMAPDKTTSNYSSPNTTQSTNTTPTSSSTPSSTDSSGTSVTAGQEQAAKMAQSYLDTMAFSRSGLIKQLKYEGFTQQQAEYGVKTVGL